WKFEDKDRFARKRVKGRAFSYEFNRLFIEALSKDMPNHPVEFFL
ncbi:ParB family protein, partial [Escherichia coli]